MNSQEDPLFPLGTDKSTPRPRAVHYDSVKAEHLCGSHVGLWVSLLINFTDDAGPELVEGRLWAVHHDDAVRLEMSDMLDDVEWDVDLPRSTVVTVHRPPREGS